MKARDIVVGLVILLIVVGLIYFRQRDLAMKEKLVVPQTLSTQEQTEQELESKFNLQIPENVEKAELKDASGGSSSGISTRNFENGKFTLSIIADLPEPQAGSFYEGWLIKGEVGAGDYSIVSTGRLSLVKGGWMIDYQSATDYSDHTKVLVSLEKKVDKTPETPILEGTF